MPEDSESPQNSPGRQRPHLTNLAKETTEEDLWDLDEDHPSGPSSIPVSEEMPVAPAEGSQESTTSEAPQSPPTDFASAPAEFAPSEREPSPPPARSDELPQVSRPNGPNTRDTQTVAAPQQVAPAAKKEATPAPSSEPAAKSPSRPEANSSANPPVAGKEKVGLLVLGVLIVGLAAWWLLSLFSNVSTTRMGDDQPDYPVEGRFIVIGEGATYWREPQREGPRPDVARSDVEFLPVLSLTVKDSETGVLRAIFRDESGAFVGDSISQNFANGAFDANANSTIEFAATDGFKTAGEFNGYRVGESRWTVDILEGPTPDAPGSEFKLLLTAPISSNRR